MINACVNMIVRNGADCVEMSLESVLPYVKKVLVCIDSRSNDGTVAIIEQLTKKYKNLKFDIFQVVDPLVDLVRMRNWLLEGIEERFGWIVDSDEVYPKEVIDEIAKLENSRSGAFAWGLTSWAAWNTEKAHAQSSRRPTMRVFRNYPKLRWDGVFGKEKLMLGKIDFCSEYVTMPLKYVHLTHLKPDSWRKEMNMLRVADGRALVEMPDDIKLIVKQYVEENMPNVRQ